MNFRLIFFIFLLFSPVYSYADVVFINTNKSYSLEVSYQFCSWSMNNWECHEPQTAKIDSGEKNYLLISAPEMSDDSTTAAMNIISSVAKDINGNVVAQGNYETGPIIGNNSDLESDNIKKYRYGWVVNFDVIQELGIISNHSSQYYYSGPPLDNLSISLKFGNQQKNIIK